MHLIHLHKICHEDVSWQDNLNRCTLIFWSLNLSVRASFLFAAKFLPPNFRHAAPQKDGNCPTGLKISVIGDSTAKRTSGGKCRKFSS